MLFTTQLANNEVVQVNILNSVAFFGKKLHCFASLCKKLNCFLQAYFLLPICLVVFCVLFFSALPVDAATKNAMPKQDLNELQKQIETLKKDLNKSQQAHKDAADELQDSEKAISNANKKLYEINQRQRQNSKALTQLKAESETLGNTLAEQQTLLSRQLYQQYIHGQQSYAQIVLESQHPSEIVRDIHYYAYVAKARAKLINNMQRNLNKVAKLNEETTNTLKEVSALKQAQIEERKTLEKQKRQKSKVVNTLSQKIAAQRIEIKKLTRDEKRLSELVQRLAKMTASAKKRKIKQKTDQNTDPEKQKPTNQVIANNDTLPTNEFSGASFAALKGKLKLPVRGQVTNRFGASREDSGISWKGLFISAPEGAEVKAVANGRVVFADWLRGFGNLVIVDHGGGYMSLYGNNQATLKQVGDSVDAGDTVASVGNSGGNEKNGVYYELRRQSKPFDPLSWSILR